MTSRAGTPELLAPAGGPDAAWAALHYGTDAIYAGLNRFSARADALNFVPESLGEVVQFAHRRSPPARVFVTINTLLLDRELDDLVETLADIQDMEADAVIVQDLGLARLARRHFPGLRLHASTQMAVHNLEGARVLRELGFSRVVLARELSLSDIRTIARQGGIEVEVFVHGALCYSMSGLCLFSSHALGRSGNRGRCAYCCREVYTDEPAAGRSGVRRLPFSMKDLALADRLDDLRHAGVTALKIEGRMKSDLYVAAVTDYYRRRLDGRIDAGQIQALEEDLRTVFSRPWTRFGLDGSARDAIDPINVGHRGAAIGFVDGVRVSAGHDGWLRFRTSRAIERHDGLQIDLPSTPRPFGFAVEKLRMSPHRSNKRAFEVIEAPAGCHVEVRLPIGYPPIPTGATVYCSSSQAVKRRYRYHKPRPGEYRRRTSICVTARTSANAFFLSATVPGNPPLSADVSIPGIYAPARKPEASAVALRQALERLGDTPWSLASIDINDPEGLFVPVSVMNDARRKLTAALSAAAAIRRAERIRTIRAAIASPTPSTARRSGEPAWSVKVAHPSQLSTLDTDALAQIREVVLLLAPATVRARLADLSKWFPQDRIRLALPTVARQPEIPSLRRAVTQLRTAGWRRWEVGNLGGFRLLADATGASVSALDLTADWPLYTLNREALRQWIEMGIRRFVLSPEDDEANTKALLALGGEQSIVLAFQYTPLFIAETPPAWGTSGAGNVDVAAFRRANERYLARQIGGRTVVVNRKPFCLAGHLARLAEAGAREFRLDLLAAPEPNENLQQIWGRLLKDEPVPGTHTGNFLRGLA